MSELTKVSVIMDQMTQPDGAKATKLRYCTAFNGCPYLLKGAKCGYARAKDGQHKGKFPPIEAVEQCPWDWHARAKELAR